MIRLKAGQRVSAALPGRIGRIAAGLGAVVIAFQASALLIASVPSTDSAAHRLFMAFDDLLSGSGSTRQRTPVPVAPTPQAADADELRRADEAVAQARTTLQRAQAEHTRALSSPDALELRLAEQELAAAETMVARAESEVNRLSGPNPAMLAAAEREVLRAEATLRATMTLRAGVSVPAAEVADDAAVQRAWLTLQDAVARHDRIRSGPPARDVAAAQDALSRAKSRRRVAVHRLEAARRAWPSASIDESNTAVIAARAALVEAEAHQRARWAGLP